MIRRIQLILALVVFAMPFVGAQADAFTSPRSEVVPIQDSVNGGSYELYIKLPEDYANKQETRYPVLYFTDALWHFELLSGATEFLMPDAILIGISWQKDSDEKLRAELGDHVSRFRDYTIRPSQNAEHQSKYLFGQADKHLSFLRKEVIAYVEKNYRTKTNQRAYFGYSAGGLFGAYTMLAHPETFNYYLLGSPSLDGELSTLSKQATRTFPSSIQPPTHAYLSYGTQETKLAGYINEFVKWSESRTSKVSLHKEIIEGDHQTAFPLTAVRSISWLTTMIKQSKAVSP